MPNNWSYYIMILGGIGTYFTFWYIVVLIVYRIFGFDKHGRRKYD